MYIAIEGLKGAGKSTLIMHLQPWLEARGVVFSVLCPTQPMPEDHELEKRAMRCEYSDADGFRETLYAARSNYHARRVSFTQPLVLGDRSIFTSFATRWQRVESMGMANYVSSVRQLEGNIPYPDHVILLSLPDDVLLARLASRQRDYGLEDECISRLEAAKTAYAELEKNADVLGFAKTHWHHVDSHQHVDDLVEVVGTYILDTLFQRNSLCA